uniref:Uncharacterized protein n=1 Tax=Rhizophagus irregularis (strain DAOM 181602 / DAOM 197198 / MUCL 43194) TaxID=747089 RepID=U9UB52_RHIID
MHLNYELKSFPKQSKSFMYSKFGRCIKRQIRFRGNNFLRDIVISFATNLHPARSSTEKVDGFFVNSSLMRFAVCKSDGVSDVFDVLNIDHMLSDIWQNENLNFSHI